MKLKDLAGLAMKYGPTLLAVVQAAIEKHGEEAEALVELIDQDAAELDPPPAPGGAAPDPEEDGTS